MRTRRAVRLSAGLAAVALALGLLALPASAAPREPFVTVPLGEMQNLMVSPTLNLQTCPAGYRPVEAEVYRLIDGAEAVTEVAPEGVYIYPIPDGIDYTEQDYTGTLYCRVGGRPAR
jgi:hypothetical protein